MHRPDPELTAEHVYLGAHTTATDLLVRIESMIFDLPAPGEEEQPVNWGHVSVVDALVQQLSGAIGILRDATRRAPR